MIIDYILKVGIANDISVTLDSVHVKINYKKRDKGLQIIKKGLIKTSNISFSFLYNLETGIKIYEKLVMFKNIKS